MPVLLPLLLSLACHSAPVPEGDAARPDIVLVSIDSLRKDHLSAYGYERNTSPFIDSLADAGVRFTGARSPSSWTLPSHTTLFSGQSSVRHQVIEESLSVDPQTPLVTESLARAGYQAGGFVSATFVSRLFGFDRGFARFEDYGLHTEKNNLDASLGAARIVDDALKWWKDQAGSPVFLFLHFYDAHFEYAPPPPHDSLFDRPVLPEDLAYKSYFHHKEHPLSAAELAHQVAQYDEGIHYVDTELRRLKTALDAAGREAIWIITSDHGEEFGERGSWGHAHTLYAEQLDIPLVFSGPGIPQGVRDGPVGLRDVAPTLTDLVGRPGDLDSDGFSLLPAIRGEPLPERSLVAETSRFESNRLALQRGTLRLEWDLGTDGTELFDLSTDPAEVTDISQDNPQAVDQLRQTLIATIDHKAWTATRAGRVRVSRGRLVDGGLADEKTLAAEESFTVWPVDAKVRHTASGTNSEQGPWRNHGPWMPGADDPVRLEPGTETRAVEISDGLKAQLEALGYLQE